MIADKLYSTLISVDNLRKACQEAYLYRSQSKAYVSPIELIYHDEDSIVSKVFNRLISHFESNPNIAYYVPRNHYLGRMYTYIEFEDLVIWFALIRTIVIQNPMILSLNSQGMLKIKDFWSNEILNTPIINPFNEGEDESNPEYDVIIQTDISAFYHSISRTTILNIVCEHLEVSIECKFIQLISKLLNSRVIDARNGDVIPIKTGLPLGNFIDDYLAQIYLKGINNRIRAINENISHVEHAIDNFTICVNLKNTEINVLELAQEIIYDIGIEFAKLGLTLNHYKTSISTKESYRSSGIEASWFPHIIDILVGDKDLCAKFIKTKNITSLPDNITSESDVKNLIIMLSQQDYIGNHDKYLILEALFKFPTEIFAHFLVNLLNEDEAIQIFKEKGVSDFVKSLILKKFLLKQQEEKFSLSYKTTFAKKIDLANDGNYMIKQYFNIVEDMKRYFSDVGR